MSTRILNMPIASSSGAVAPQQNPRDLVRKDSNLMDHEFAYEGDIIFWRSIVPAENSQHIPTSKMFHHFWTRILGAYTIEQRMQSRIEKTLKKFLKIKNDDDFISLTSFVYMTKYIGPFKQAGNKSCVFLLQIQRLVTESMINVRGTRISWFAGHMTQEEAENKLINQDINTFLIRFSESLRNEGGYALAVKTKTGVRHFHIVGDPVLAATSNPYHAHLKLQHNENPEDNEVEESYSDIVNFYKARIFGQEIEDDVACDNICPNLPLNVDFRGYN